MSKAPANASVPAAWVGIHFGITTLLGAFLVFQVQPIISKCVLPWFGGTPAVWTTCMLFFQCVLFAGYLYAHLLKTYLSPRFQALVHLALLTAAAFSLPIQPSEAWKPTGGESPVSHLLLLLAANVGLPYFVLSSTGPLVQAWFSFHHQTERVYRLYALSNIGSLSALISYPFLVEPLFSVSAQSRFWSLAFCTFVLFQGLIATRLLRFQKPAGCQTEDQSDAQVKPSWSQRVSWLLLPAFASMMLLVVTNHVSQDVAVIPFLWVLPLALYLLSFIICFDSPNWYRPKLIATLTIIGLAGCYCQSLIPGPLQLVGTVVAYMTALFGICLLCHGELARLKPSVNYLTHYYVAMSGGGALGGLIVAVMCPWLLTSHLELPITLAVASTITVIVFFAARSWKRQEYHWPMARRIGSIAAVVAILPVLSAIFLANPNTIASTRNFFGVLRVEKFSSGTRLVHGNTIHGMQLSGERENLPTTYYGAQSGVALSWRALQQQKPSMQIGIVGLGCGVLATYGRPGDEMDLIEINPAMIDLAENHFTFLANTPAQWETHLGDGRLILESMPAARYDLLILDAFSSDAIPAHLLTTQAFQSYRRSLKPDGVLVVHVSNNHLDLPPLVQNLARSIGWDGGVIQAAGDPTTMTMHSTWVVIAQEEHDIWTAPSLQSATKASAQQLLHAPLWTDDKHDLTSVLKLW